MLLWKMEWGFSYNELHLLRDLWWPFLFFTPFSPQFHGIQLVVTVLSHRCNSRTDSGEAKVVSRASPETQPNQAALLLDTMPS